MANVRAIRSRIRSVQNIRQITRAMEMVATTKLRRFQGRAEAFRPYAGEVRALVADLAAAPGALAGLDLLRPRADGRPGVLLLTSDRGLCGPYNNNALEALVGHLEGRAAQEPVFYVFGRKGREWLKKNGYGLEAWFHDPGLEHADFLAAQAVAQRLQADFRNGVFSDLVLVYTRFLSMVRYQPAVEPLLPVDPAELAGGASRAGEFILEPGGPELLADLVPRYIEVRIYNAMLQALTSEYASRRVSMKNATDAAADMGKALTRTYNRARQENITKELLDIVTGAEALR